MCSLIYYNIRFVHISLFIVWRHTGSIISKMLHFNFMWCKLSFFFFCAWLFKQGYTVRNQKYILKFVAKCMHNKESGNGLAIYQRNLFRRWHFFMISESMGAGCFVLKLQSLRECHILMAFYNLFGDFKTCNSFIPAGKWIEINKM